MRDLLNALSRSMPFLVLIFILTLLFTSTVTAVTLPDQVDQAAGPHYKSGELLVKLREGVAVSNSHALARSLGVSHAKNLGAPRKDTGPAARQLNRWWVVQLPPGLGVEAAMDRLKSNPNVEVVEPNFERTLYSIPDDTLFYELWGLDNTGQLGGTIDADIDAPEAWDRQASSSGVVVAVIDSGIDYDHEDLAANIWTNTGEIPGNGIDDDGNGYIDDVHGYNFSYRNGDPIDDVGHGTHIAGVIAAVGNNGVGVTGVSWSAKLMALKVNNVFGSITVEDTINAMVYAVDMGANVINASYGSTGTQYSSVAEEDAIRAVNEANILFVAAAGNSTNDNDFNPSYPAGYDSPNIIAVAATDRDDNLAASFSNYGATSVDLGAPGAEILSTVPAGTCTVCDPSGYRSFDGTSVAASYVSGAAALLLERSPSLSVQDLKAALLNSVDLVPSLAGMTVTGGRLNLNTALGLLPYGAAFNPPVKAIPNDGSSAGFTLTLTSYDNFTDTLTLSLDTLVAGLSATLSDTTVTLPANGTVSATVNVTTTEGMPRGSYPIRVTMTDSTGHTITAEATLRILVPGFTVDITPDELYADLGGTLPYNVVVDAYDGFAGTVSLSADASNRNIKTTLAKSVTLPLNGSVTTTLTVNVGTRTPLDIHTLTVTGTSGTESATATALVNLIPMYDLVITDLSISSTTLYTGTPYTVSATTENQGSMYGPVAVWTDFYMSPDDVLDCDANGCTNGDFNTNAGGVCGGGYYIPNGMPAGATCDITRTLTLSSEGTYYLIAKSFKADGNTADEINVANNTKVVGPITIKRDIDFTPSNTSLSSTTVQEGGTLTVNSTVTNLGKSMEYVSLKTGFYLSSNNVIDPQTDQYLGSYYIHDWLGEGDSAQTVWGTSQLIGVRSGDQYLGVFVDDQDEYDESDETNNVEVVPITVTSDIDLVAQHILKSGDLRISQGETFTVDNQVKNEGTSGTSWSGFTVGYYLSTDPDPQGDLGTLIGSRYVDYLRAGNISPASDVPVTVPFNLPLGTYYLKIMADSTNTQVETNKANNVWVYWNPLSVIPPRVPTTTSWVTAPTDMDLGATQTLKVKVAPDSGALDCTDPVVGCGEVRFLDGAQVSVVSGVAYNSASGFYEASCNWTPTSSGTHTIKAEYLSTSVNFGSFITGTAVINEITVSLAAGFAQTYELRSGGTLWAWGWNGYGQLGIGDETHTDQPIPTQINDTDWVAVSAGEAHAVAIKSNGTLWAWGANYHGELGDGTTTDRDSPGQVGSDTDWMAVSTGGAHTVAVKSDGTLWAWGWNNYGQLGIGDETHTDNPIPTQVGSDTDWVAVSAGGCHTVALKSDGTLWAWGANLNGQLGIGDDTVPWEDSPVQVGSDTDWLTLAAGGGDHTVAIKSNGTLWAWGWNTTGQLGIGSTLPGVEYSPVQVGADTWVSASVGYRHTVAIKSDGTLWAWGVNHHGQLGIGDETQVDHPSPTQVGSDTDWVAVAAGADHTVAFESNGTLWAWGSNWDGQLGIGELTETPEYSPVPVQVH